VHRLALQRQPVVRDRRATRPPVGPHDDDRLVHAEHLATADAYRTRIPACGLHRPILAIDVRASDRISPSAHPETVELVVRDDGVGFDPGAAGEGFGLLGMQERAELLGGELTVESRRGQGTTVTARLPTRRRDEDERRAS